jgi:hypothetical protein
MVQMSPSYLSRFFFIFTSTDHGKRKQNSTTTRTREESRRCGQTWDLDDRRLAEVIREQVDVYRGAHYDQLEVRVGFESSAQEDEQNVGGDVPFVRLVDYHVAHA